MIPLNFFAPFPARLLDKQTPLASDRSYTNPGTKHEVQLPPSPGIRNGLISLPIIHESGYSNQVEFYDYWTKLFDSPGSTLLLTLLSRFS